MLRKSQLHFKHTKLYVYTSEPDFAKSQTQEAEVVWFCFLILRVRFAITTAAGQLARKASRDLTQLQVLTCQSDLDSQMSV